MKALVKAALPAFALAAAGCQVNVDQNAQAKLDNAEAAIDRAADGVENAAGSAAGMVENAADDLGNGVDVNVRTGNDGNEAAANRQ
jgi:hypothetical protein